VENTIVSTTRGASPKLDLIQQFNCFPSLHRNTNTCKSGLKAVKQAYSVTIKIGAKSKRIKAAPGFVNPNRKAVPGLFNVLK